MVAPAHGQVVDEGCGSRHPVCMDDSITITRGQMLRALDRANRAGRNGEVVTGFYISTGGTSDGEVNLIVRPDEPKDGTSSQ